MSYFEGPYSPTRTIECPICEHTCVYMRQDNIKCNSCHGEFSVKDGSVHKITRSASKYNLTNYLESFITIATIVFFFFTVEHKHTASILILTPLAVSLVSLRSYNNDYNCSFEIWRAFFKGKIRYFDISSKVFLYTQLSTFSLGIIILLADVVIAL